MLGIVVGDTLVLVVFFSVILIDAFADSLIVNFDKKFYDLGDSITISGEISEVGMPVIAMNIYDPFGMPAEFYFSPIDSNFEFTTSFLVKDGVNFRVDGIYSVKAHYAESEVISFFDYHKIPSIVAEEDSPENQIDENEPVGEDINNLKDHTSNL